MNNYVTLLGAEEVTRAGHSIANAARQMQQAASQMDEALRHHQMFLTQWLDEYRQIALMSPAVRGDG